MTEMAPEEPLEDFEPLPFDWDPDMPVYIEEEEE